MDIERQHAGEDEGTQVAVHLLRGVTTRRGAGPGAPAQYVPGPDPDAEEPDAEEEEAPGDGVVE